MTPRVTPPATLLCPAASRIGITHEAFLPSALREFQNELAGRLAMHETPGEQMQQLREKYGFTQEQLAGLLGLRRESLSRIEGGRIALTLPVLQRFSRIVTLARGVREHLAWAEARGNIPDERHLNDLAQGLHVDKEAADDIILSSTMAYDRKRKEALRQLPSRRL